jgi:mono/diheme cytochrome c family protein
MQKLVVFSLFFLAIYACANKAKNDSPQELAETSVPTIDGASIYKTRCELCHGADGKLGANGSKDLTVSDLELNERIAMITNGKGAMTAFKDILSLQEIKAVAEYSLTLKK